MNVIFKGKVIYYKVQFDEYRVDGTDSIFYKFIRRKIFG